MRKLIAILFWAGSGALALGQPSCPGEGPCQGSCCSAQPKEENRTVREEHLDIANRIVAGDYQEAVARLKRLVWLKTANAKTYALLALAYNRLGSWKESLEASDEALKRGGDTQVLHRERAVAWAGLGEYRRALKELRKADPSDPRTSELIEEIGELSGRNDRPEAKAEPLKDPAASRGQDDLDAEEKSPDSVSRLSMALKAWWETVERPVAPKKGWPSPGEIGQGQDESASFALDAAYTLGNPGSSPIWGPSINVYRNFYDDLPDFEYTRVEGALFAKATGLRWICDASTGLAYAWLGEKGYAKSAIPGLELTYIHPERPDLERWTQLFLEAAYTDYVGEVPWPEGNRSGWFPTAALRHTLFLNRSRTKLGMEGYWRNHSSLGASYVGDLLGVQAFVGQKLPLDFQFHLRFGFEGDWFENGTVPSGTGELREDDAFVLEAGLEKAVVDRVSLFLRYAHNDVNSNLDRFFTYRQNVFSAGVALTR